MYRQLGSKIEEIENKIDPVMDDNGIYMITVSFCGEEFTCFDLFNFMLNECKEYIITYRAIIGFVSYKIFCILFTQNKSQKIQSVVSDITSDIMFKYTIRGRLKERKIYRFKCLVVPVSSEIIFYTYVSWLSRKHFNLFLKEKYNIENSMTNEEFSKVEIKNREEFERYKYSLFVKNSTETILLDIDPTQTEHQIQFLLGDKIDLFKNDT